MFNIKPDYDLSIMRENQTLTDITTNVLEKIQKVYQSFHPDWVFVHGDTTTCFAASLASFYLGHKVAHIEAGLRSHNLLSPWPEEMNRKMTAVITKKHYAPTESAKKNLIKENLDPLSIVVTGNTVVDALLHIHDKINSSAELKNKLEKKFSYLNPKKKLILTTFHRRELFGEGVHNVCEALLEISKRDDIEFIFPVHPNPNIKKPVSTFFKNNKNIHLIEPIDYLSLIYLLEKAYLVVTDSGGLQEEAPTFKKPVLVLRDTTERYETIKAGSAKLIGTNTKNIIQEITTCLDDESAYKKMSSSENPYGDGKAAERIIEDLKKDIDTTTLQQPGELR